MTITQSTSRSHWNYFLALEGDFLQLARYVEPAPENYGTYSIELARLLMAASAEVDVVLKMLCRRIRGGAKAVTIDRYRKVIRPAFPFLESAPVAIPRYGLEFVPWLKWQSDSSPDWWIAHNEVKHQRDAHYRQGNMQHAINALGALYLCLLAHYGSEDPKCRLAPVPGLFEAAPDIAQVVHTAIGTTVVYFDHVDWISAWPQ
ncbi:MAG: hypothetical protein Q8N51_07975 [Gammaproteobacteria bacterium]|nr:hypothetical protein [Gammaproteobacteria bacterium]